MARKPRTRVNLSFSEGHRLVPAFKAVGMEAIPSAQELRALLELGLAAMDAGFHAGPAGDGTFKLLQPIEVKQVARPASPVEAGAQPPVGDLPTSTMQAETSKVVPPKVRTEAADRAHVEPCPEEGRGATGESVDVSQVGVQQDAEEEPEIDDASRQLLTAALQF